MEENTEKDKKSDKKMFVMLMRYSTPVTVSILLYVGLVVLEAELVTLIPIIIMIIIEIVMGVKAEELYDYFNSQNE